MKKYSKRFAKFYSDKLNLALLITVVFFLLTTIAFRYSVEDRTRTTLTEQTLLREQTIVRSGAMSIESFLNLSGKSLVLIAENLDIASDSSKIQETLEKFVSDWKKTPIVGVTLSDKDGIIQLSSGELGVVEPGTSMADRDYFIWAKKAQEGEIFVGEPILPRGLAGAQFILPLATPVYQDGEFVGVLGVAVLLSELAEVYLEPLRISQGTQVYLISLDGIFLHSPYPELVGESILDHLRQYPFLGNERIVKMIEERLHKAEEGTFEFAWPALYGKTNLTEYLLAYFPVRFDSQSWTLAVATPIDDTLAFYKPYKILKIVSLFIVFLFIIFFSAFIVFAMRITRRDAFQNGFNHRKNHNDKKKRV